MNYIGKNISNRTTGFVTDQSIHKVFKARNQTTTRKEALLAQKRRCQDKQTRVGKRMEGDMVITSFNYNEDLEWRCQWTHHSQTFTCPDRIKTHQQVECLKSLCLEDSRGGIDRQISGKKWVAINLHRVEEEAIMKSLKNKW